MEKNQEFKIVPMKMPNDKDEIVSWEEKYKNTLQFEGIKNFILEGSTYHGLGEVIYTNFENFPIGDDERQLSLVAKNKNNEIIAWILCDVFNLQTANPEMFLQYIIINPKFQNQGYGKSILNELFSVTEKYLQTTPTNYFCYINLRNYASQKLFSKFGFTFDTMNEDYFKAQTQEPKLLIENTQTGLGE